SDHTTPLRRRYRTVIVPPMVTPPFATVGIVSASAAYGAPSGPMPTRPSTARRSARAFVCVPVEYSGLSVSGCCQAKMSVPPERVALVAGVAEGAQAMTSTARRTSLRKTFGREKTDGVGGLAVEREVGADLADDARELEAVARARRGDDDVGVLNEQIDDEVRVGRVRV